MKRFRFLKYAVLISLLLTSLSWGAATDYKVKSDGTIYGYDLITKGPWVDSRSSTSITIANTAAYNAGKLLLITQNYTLTGANTLTANIMMMPGGSFTHTAGSTLAFSSSFQNPSNIQCFIGFDVGDVTFAAGSIKQGEPQWFGCLLDGSVDCKVAYDSAVASVPIGGTVHIPVGKSKISTAWSFSKQVNLKGDGPGSILWIQGLAGSNAITFGPSASYTYGVHWQDFAILGGATCATNGLVIRNVNNSQFDNIHVMLGSTIASVWIKTFGIINKYNFIISSNMITSYAYTPSIHEGKAIYASDAADAPGVFNANIFDCIIEGGDGGYGLHIISGPTYGVGNTIMGTYEGINGEFAVLVEGGIGTRVKDTFFEATTANKNKLKFLNHGYGYIGPGVASFPKSGGGGLAGYDDIELVNADNLIIDGLLGNRISIDATTTAVRIEEISLVTSGDPGITDLGTGTRYYKAGSNATIADSTPTTIFTPSGTAAMWDVFVFLHEEGVEYLANARIMWDGANARIVSENGTYMTLTLSGNNVQVTQTSGGAANVFYRYSKGVSR